ncbi:unnamed protein product, partial [Effrenium voratum]
MVRRRPHLRVSAQPGRVHGHQRGLRLAGGHGALEPDGGGGRGGHGLPGVAAAAWSAAASAAQAALEHSNCFGDGTPAQNQACRYHVYWGTCVLTAGCNWHGESALGGWCTGGVQCTYQPLAATCVARAPGHPGLLLGHRHGPADDPHVNGKHGERRSRVRCAMVGRFESAELKRDALAHEVLSVTLNASMISSWSEIQARLQISPALASIRGPAAPRVARLSLPMAAEQRRLLAAGAFAAAAEAAPKLAAVERAALLAELWPKVQVALRADASASAPNGAALAWLAAAADLRPQELEPAALQPLAGLAALAPDLAHAAEAPGAGPGAAEAACRALRNLARLPRLRRPLAAAAAAAVAKLAEDAALCGSAAAALCNLGCCPEGRPATVRALPALLRHLPHLPPAEADDVAACVGVVISGPLEAVPLESVVSPLVDALGHEDPVLTGTLLEVLCDLVVASGPGGAVAPMLAAQKRFAAGLPAQLRRAPALRLCVLLQDFPGFRDAFRAAGG